MSAPSLRSRPDICEAGRAGPQNRPLHKLWWEIKAPDKAAAGQNLGGERCLSVSTRAQQLFSQRKQTLPFPEGSLERSPSP